jgi:hypothetical protein
MIAFCTESRKTNIKSISDFVFQNNYFFVLGWLLRGKIIQHCVLFNFMTIDEPLKSRI